MPNELLLGYSGEGDTDRRFLGPLIQRTFEELLFEAKGQIWCMEPEWIGVAKGKNIAVAAVEAGVRKLRLYCVHVDEDGNGYPATIKNQLQPSLDILSKGNNHYPPIIPVCPKEETESWMLADTDTLRRILNTRLTNAELGLHGSPENYTDPKQKLIEVIRKLNLEVSRYAKIDIKDLYAPIGVDCSLDILRNLASYKRFEAEARAGLVEIGFLW